MTQSLAFAFVVFLLTISQSGFLEARSGDFRESLSADTGAAVGSGAAGNAGSMAASASGSVSGSSNSSSSSGLSLDAAVNVLGKMKKLLCVVPAPAADQVNQLLNCCPIRQLFVSRCLLVLGV